MALAVLLLAPGLGRAPFDDPGEGQHAEIAREMLGGSWLTLRLNGVRYFDKPPLLYWLTAVSFRLFGLTEGAARLAPLLGALLAVGGDRTAGRAAAGARRGRAGRPRAAVLRAVRGVRAVCAAGKSVRGRYCLGLYGAAC